MSSPLDPSSTPKYSRERVLVIFLSGDAQRLEFFEEHGLVVDGQPYPQFLVDLLVSQVNKAVKHVPRGKTANAQELDRIAEQTLEIAMNALTTLVHSAEVDGSLLNCIIHVSRTFAATVQHAFGQLKASGKTNDIRLKIDLGVAGLPRPIARGDSYRTTFRVPPMTRKQQLTPRVLSLGLGMTLEATEKHIRDGRAKLRIALANDPAIEELVSSGPYRYASA